jgi:hypothetical protein
MLLAYKNEFPNVSVIRDFKPPPLEMRTALLWVVTQKVQFSLVYGMYNMYLPFQVFLC